MSELMNNEKIDMICGCGKPARYILNGIGSCNKYARCPSYDEILGKLKQAENKLSDIQKIIEDRSEAISLFPSKTKMVEKATFNLNN